MSCQGYYILHREYPSLLECDLGSFLKDISDVKVCSAIRRNLTLPMISNPTLRYGFSSLLTGGHACCNEAGILWLADIILI
jgi:hypothetical protein